MITFSRKQNDFIKQSSQSKMVSCPMFLWKKNWLTETMEELVNNFYSCETTSHFTQDSDETDSDNCRYSYCSYRRSMNNKNVTRRNVFMSKTGLRFSWVKSVKKFWDTFFYGQKKITCKIHVTGFSLYPLKTSGDGFEKKV